MEYSVENHWWREGWRLVRERLSEFLTPRRWHILIRVAVVSLVVASVGTMMLTTAIDTAGVARRVLFVLLATAGITGMAVGISFHVLSRAERRQPLAGGRVPLSMAQIFNLRQPLVEISSSDRTFALQLIEEQRRALPLILFGLSLAFGGFALAFIAFAVSGRATVTAPLWIVVILLNASSLVPPLRLLGSSTAVLRRIERTGGGPTYRGPKGWGIEAPRNAPGSEADAG